MTNKPDAKKQTTIRMSAATREKLAKLAARYGTQTEVVAVAIDRLYRDKIERRMYEAHEYAQLGQRVTEFVQAQQSTTLRQIAQHFDLSLGDVVELFELTDTLVLTISRNREEVIQMDAQDLIRNLESQYHGMVAANLSGDAPTLFDYLIRMGIDPNDIWEYSPQIGRDAGQEEPDWL